MPNPFQKSINAARLKNFGNMPRLKHRPDPFQPFDWEKSEVGHWLSQNPKALDLVFEALKSSSAIEYDPVTREWKGIHTL